MSPQDEKRVRQIVAEMLAEYKAEVLAAFREGLKPIRPSRVRDPHDASAVSRESESRACP